MRNKPFIIILTIIVTILCAYYLSFSFISKGVQKKAEAYATDARGNVDMNKKQTYLDSVWKRPVFSFLGADFTYQDVQKSELSLGLDLKGGMHVTMEVSPVEIIKVMSGNSKDPNFLKAIDMAKEMQKNSQERFVTLFGNAYRQLEPNGQLSRIFSNTANRGKISYESSNDEVLEVIDNEVEGAIERSFNVLRTRIDKFGVNEPKIQRLKGTGRIQIELPGVDNPNRVRKLLQGQAKLEFWEVWNTDEFMPYFGQMGEYLAKQEAATKLKSETATPAEDKLSQAATTDTDPLAQAAAEDTTSLASKLESTDTTKATAQADSLNNQQSSALAKLFTQLPNGIGSNVRDTAQVNRLFRTPQIRTLFPANMQFLWGVKPIVGQDGQEFLELYAVKKGREAKAPVSGEFISDARQDFDQQGRPEVNMQMNTAGGKRWQRLTGENIGRQVAIVLDDYVYSAPVVQSEIAGANSSISGNFTIEEAQDLANILKAGKMPAPTRIVEEAIVGPSLGQEAINQGVLSSLAAILLVVFFMVLYYSKGGLIANLALIFNVFFIVGILAQLNAALTLPGIAGIILTIGMAVDANVLIFERIREELRHGLTLKDAIHKGYDKAFSSIFDSNVTTLLAGLILFYFGSGPVKGFATTLMIGIATSFFTAVFLSRLFVEYLASKREDGMSFSTGLSKNAFQNLKFDVIKHRKKAYIFSTSVIVLGFAIMIMQGGPNLGVDFTGGRSYIVNFDEAVPADEVKQALTTDFKEAGTEVKTFGSSNRLKIITSYLSDEESTEADNTVLAALESGLKKYDNLNPKVLSSSKVGATMADDIQKTALMAILLSFVGIFIYITIRFQDWSYALGGIAALIHDSLMVIAFFPIARLFGLNLEMDQVFVASVLTVIGFSINDTVVIYDRIRETLADNPRMKFREIVNPALNATFSRTIITSLTVLMVVVVLFIFGGETLRGFSFAMIVGVLFGSYSSLFIATPITLETDPDKRREKKLNAVVPTPVA
ncbi:MAG TPA: protein translocase subunit SecDF, partial [Adhaeribacter sp.]|nr:protein translocase subunit SecDF [Adhaeribacter sp.]